MATAQMAIKLVVAKTAAKESERKERAADGGSAKARRGSESLWETQSNEADSELSEALGSYLGVQGSKP